MFTSLKGRSVIVTGASRGIGRGIARRFGAVGCGVLVVSRDRAAAATVAAEIQRAGGIAHPFAADVSRPGDTEAMARFALEQFGGIDILCANAGIFPAAKLGQMTEADFDAVIGTNLKGTFLSVSACLPAMKTRRFGRIVLTSSITGPVTGLPGWAHHGITVNAVLPGNIATDGLTAFGDDYLRGMAASVPMRRLGSVDDIANAALFFASEEAAYITGQSLVIDGGQILPESLAAVEG
jgi:3-oxoacyl-[acyl-carrier protein] reductase